MSYNFKNKVAVITGGCSGIGKAAAMAFADNGCHIEIIDNYLQNEWELVEHCNTRNVQIRFQECNIASESDIKNAVENIYCRWNQLDFAVNAVGIVNESAKTGIVSNDEWDRVMNVNVKSLLLAMKYEIQAMKKTSRGSIVNCAIAQTSVTEENDPIYVASTYTIWGLTRNAAVEYAGKGIRINSISPGIIHTSASETMDKEKSNQIKTRLSMKRLVSPEEIANIALWFCSDDASFAVGLNMALEVSLSTTSNNKI